MRACGRRGHLTYAPDEPALRARLHASTALGQAWRCLRCGDFVLGAPAASGPAQAAPVPARGKALRQVIILRVLAVERTLRGLVLLAGGYGIWRFSSAQRSLRETFGGLLPAARPLADRLGVDLDNSTLVRDIGRVLNARHSTLILVATGLVAYGLLELVEGVGLWLLRRWAEYLTVVATAAFLPLEIYELTKAVTATKLAAFVINVAVVVYLIVAKRLFGVRGGRRAYAAELAEDSLLEVEAAAVDRDEPDRASEGREIGMGEPAAKDGERPSSR